MPASQKRDPYEVLGVKKDTPAEEIKRAYRRAALKFHPDKNPDNEEAEKLFREATEAYETLSDPERRKRFDQFGHEGMHGFEGRNFSNLDDIFAAFGDVFGGRGGDSVFERFFGGGRAAHRSRRRGADLQAEITIDLADVLNGIKRPVTVRRSVPCEPCGGSGAKSGTKPERCNLCEGHGEVLQSHGFFNVRTTCPQCGGAGRTIRSPCPACRGAGRSQRSGDLEIHIPAGVEDGMQLRVEGQGEAGGGGGDSGDLYCAIRVREHPFFTRKGDDLHCAVPITFPQAALGAQVEVPTLQGITKMRVPPGSQPGQTLRLRGQGIPNVRGYGRGDLLVHLELEVPAKLTRRQEELLQEFGKIEDKNVGPQRKGFLDRLRDMFQGG